MWLKNSGSLALEFVCYKAPWTNNPWPILELVTPNIHWFSYLHTFFLRKLLYGIIKDGQAIEASLMETLEESGFNTLPAYRPYLEQLLLAKLLIIGLGCLHLPQLQKLDISFSLIHNQSFTFIPDLMANLIIWSGKNQRSQYHTAYSIVP